MSTVPALFISHGSPMMAFEKSVTSSFLRALPRAFPRPASIIVISAHWETQDIAVTGDQTPKTIHDFGDFPPELYAIHYTAHGKPDLAGRVNALLNDHGITSRVDETRGFDHGVWSPLILMYPEADIPVIEISVQPHQSALHHYRVGQILAPLRDENILIIGTGNLTHNLREAMRGNYTDTPEWVSAFSDWIADRVAAGDTESLLNWDTLAPYAMKNHPSPDHFMPFFAALGAGSGTQKIHRLNATVDYHVLAMDCYAYGDLTSAKSNEKPLND